MVDRDEDEGEDVAAEDDVAEVVSSAEVEDGVEDDVEEEETPADDEDDMVDRRTKPQSNEDDEDDSETFIQRWLRKVIPVTEEFDGNKLRTRIDA